MNKKIILIFSLIFSIISLIYLFLVQYGVDRYVFLHHFSTESYLEKYPQLDKADKDRVVICFSASEKELKKLKPFVNSLLDQTVRVNEIVLNIPYKDMDKVPSEYKKVLSVRGYSKDYENASNAVCSVLCEPEAKTKIIIVEPGIIYGKDFVQTMVEQSNKNPNKIIYGGKNKKEMLIKPEFFTDKISEYEKGSKCCDWIEKCCGLDSIFVNYKENFNI